MVHPKVLGLIPSRFASTRFPGKPLALIAGKSLIQRTFESAQSCKSIHSLYVATDDDLIASHVSSFGGKVIMTSKNCKNGTERLAEALQLNPSIKGDIVINIQGDHPTISPLMLQSLIDTMKKHPTTEVATLVCPSRKSEDYFSPHVVKCVFDQNFSAQYFSRSPIPFTRKEPLFYHHIGLYAYRYDFLLSIPNLMDTPLQLSEDLEQLKFLENGYSIKVAIVDEPAFGVDTPEDITKIEKILCR